jgi:small-conductance mechanosensitive channel
MRIFLCLLLAVSAVQARPTSKITDTDTNANIPALPTQQLDAIRQIGRNVLQAKKKGRDEPADNGQLSQLRATVDKLIAAETPASPTNGIRLEKEAQATATNPPDQGEPARQAARTHALDVVAKLRQDGNHLHGTAKAPAKTEAYSAGFPVGQQRGRLFEHWADKLEATLGGDDTKRLAQLKGLREQLSPEKHGIIDTPMAHKTPTIQAMPWETPKVPAKKMQRKTTATK